ILIWRPSRDVSGKPLGLGASLFLGSHGILRFSSLGVISFLRGRLINHDTPPNTSTYPIETKSPPVGQSLLYRAAAAENSGAPSLIVRGPAGLEGFTDEAGGGPAA